MANDSTKNAVLVQFQLAMVPFSKSQYNGPTAVHSASHRQASAASVHRAAAPTRARRGWAAATGSEEAGDVMTVYGSRTGQRMQMCDGRRLTGGLQTQARPL